MREATDRMRLAVEGAVRGLAKELDINESYLEKLAEEVRKDLG
jgi:hypothetical protein